MRISAGIWFLIFMGMSLLMLAGYRLVLHFVRARRRLRWVLAGAFGLIISVTFSLLLIELGMRIYYSSFGTPRDRLLYTSSVAEILAALKSGQEYIAAPYINYVPNPEYQGHNELGYRGAEIAIPKPAGTYRIVVMGDSVTYGQWLSPEQAYPGQLQQVLQNDYGYRNVEVVNAGVLAYSSWDMLVNLSFRILDLEPDLVIFYPSWNDVLARAESTADCYQGTNPRRGLNPLRQVAVPAVNEPSPSTLLRFLDATLNPQFTDPTTSFSQYDDGLCQATDNESVLQHLEQNPPIYFKRNLRNTIAIAQANRVGILLSTEAYYRPPDPKVKSWWWQAAVEDQNVILQQVAPESGAAFYDLMAVIEQNPDYWMGDGFHLTAEGTHEYGRLFAAYLVSSGWLGQSAK